jgi:hypothetical protein
MKFFQVVFLILLLAGCSSNPSVSQTTSPNLPPGTSPIPTETVAVPSQTLAPTSTPLPILTSPPLWTPFPTFSEVDGVEKLRIWIQGVFDCLLPCWGGITPGKTSWQEARQVVEQMSGFASVNVSENMSCGFGGCNGIAWSLYPNTVAEGAFYTKLPENIVHFIHINIQNEGNNQKVNLVRNIGLQEVFRWYGEPPMLLFNVETDQAENRFMELIMVYPERQFIVRYVKLTELKDDQIINCGQDQQVELFILDNKEQLASFATITGAIETRELPIDSRYKTIEEATGMSRNSFYDAISTYGDFCISTPVDLWSP